MTSVIGDSAQHKLDAEGIDPLLFTGVNDSNLHRISSLYKVQLALRGDHLVISGKLSAVEDAIPFPRSTAHSSQSRTPMEDIMRSPKTA